MDNQGKLVLQENLMLVECKEKLEYQDCKVHLMISANQVNLILQKAVCKGGIQVMKNYKSSFQVVKVNLELET